MSRTLWVILIVSLLLPFGAAKADTLEMKDGALVEGKFMGGTQNSIRFKADEQLMTYPVGDVLAITFTQSEGAGATPPPPAHAAESRATSPATPSAPITVPAGPRVLVRTAEALDSSRHGRGHMFTAILEGDLTANGKVVATSGSRVYGRLTDAKKSGRMVGQAKLTIAFTDIMIDDKPHPIVSSEIMTVGERTGGKTARNVGVGAGIGALAKGKSSKKRKRGAAQGAAVGLAASVLTSGSQVRIPAETLLEFRLEQPFVYTP